MNVRHFALSDGTEWFGGGIDPTESPPSRCTPTFQTELKDVCRPFPVHDYQAFKEWATTTSSSLERRYPRHWWHLLPPWPFQWETRR